jgi:hypothetical protein
MRIAYDWALSATLALAIFSNAVLASSRNGGSSYDYGFDVRKFVKRQDDGPVVIARLPDVNGSAGLRPNIRSIRNTQTWHMYILAMDMMMWTDQGNPGSWYQVAGKSAIISQSGGRYIG